MQRVREKSSCLIETKFKAILGLLLSDFAIYPSQKAVSNNKRSSSGFVIYPKSILPLLTIY